MNYIKLIIMCTLACVITLAGCSSESGSGNSQKTGVNNVGYGIKKSIVIDGSNTLNEWSSDTLLALDPAADDARFLGTNWCAHEAPWDYVQLHAAWDNNNLYIGIQYVNVTDVIDPSNIGSSSGVRITSMDLIQSIVFDTVDNYGYSTGGDMWLKDQEFIGAEKPDYQLYFHSNFSQEGLYIGKWTGSTWIAVTNGSSNTNLKGKGGTFFVGTELYGVDPHADDSDAGDYGTVIVEYLTEGHSTSYDAFFEIAIPLSTLGIDSSRLDNGVIGVFAFNGDGSAVDSIPDDDATKSTTGVNPGNSPLEWSSADDDDKYSQPFILIGNGH